jgi:hypothetical protein
VKFTSLAGAGVTKAAIACSSNNLGTTVAPVSENGAADPALDDTNEVYRVVPGTYTCTIVIDP